MPSGMGGSERAPEPLYVGSRSYWVCNTSVLQHAYTGIHRWFWFRIASVTTQFSYSLFSLCLETQRRSHAHTTRRKCEIVQNRECAALRAVEHKSTGAAPSGATHVPPHTCATTYTYCIASTGLELETPISSDMREQGRSRGRAERDASAERARVDSHHCSLTRDRVHANHEARRQP